MKIKILIAILSFIHFRFCMGWVPGYLIIGHTES